MIGRWSHREYLTRLAWLDLQWNEPNRSDHYAMQIVQAIRQMFNKSDVSLGSQKIPFKFQRPEEVEQDKATRDAAAARLSKTRWIGAVFRGSSKQRPKGKR